MSRQRILHLRVIELQWLLACHHAASLRRCACIRQVRYTALRCANPHFDRPTAAARGRAAVIYSLSPQNRSLVKNHRFFPLLNFSSKSFLASLAASTLAVGFSTLSAVITFLSSTSRV
jgi:hypothetical protein